MSDDDLSITAANRHQYFKTVMASADDSERKILEAKKRVGIGIGRTKPRTQPRVGKD